MSDLSLLSGVKRKSDFWAVRSAFDPGCVKTCTSQECAELFSLSSSLSSGRKHFWFSNLRNRDVISTRRLNVGVFTRPRPEADFDSDEHLLAWLRSLCWSHGPALLCSSRSRRHLD